MKSIEDHLHERFDFHHIEVDENTLLTRVEFYEKKNEQILNRIISMMKDIEAEIKNKQIKIDGLRAEDEKIYKAAQMKKQVSQTLV